MDWEYCKEILPRVSRTFALNIDKLQEDTYRAVLLGYLLFRIADTFEDNIYQDESQKIKALNDFSEVFKGDKDLNKRLKAFESLKFRWQEESPDKDLVENGDRIFNCYFELPEVYRKIMDPLLAETSEGMAEFQKRRLESSPDIFQLRDIEDLEHYCYYVAGIVGIMLTDIFCQHGAVKAVREQLEKHQVYFGLALQVTNIIKDYKKDIQRGWCYIPVSLTEKYGIKLEKINNLSLEQKKGILQELAPRILGYFDSSLEYIKIIPKSEKSIRLFCIIPFVLAYNTLLHITRMKGDKISREDVAGILQNADYYQENDSLLEKDYFRIKNIISEVYN